MNKDLTRGKPSKVLWLFCLPLFGSIIFQQLYNIADSLIAGKFIGELALAAVGNGYEITLIFIAFAFGTNIGCSVICSKLFGAREYKNLKTSVSTTFIASSVLCAILMILGFVLVRPLLGIINTPDNILNDSLTYLNIYILGFPFVLFYNVATGIFSALGDSKTPFIFLACSSIANVVMDIIFVACLHMGVAGVAWATFICQGISCVLALIFVFKRLKKIEEGNDEKAPLFSWTLLKLIAVIAIPSILQQSFISVGNIIIQGAINSFGSEVVAGYSASVKLNNLVITSLTTMGNGMSNYTAQNLGANKNDRVKEGFKSGSIMALILVIPFILLYTLGGEYLIKFFIDEPSAAALQTGKEFLLVISPFYVIVCIKLICDGILRGAGMMKEFMIATFVDLTLRVVLALVFANTIGIIGIWCSWPISWAIAMIISVCFYKFGKLNKVAIN